MRLPSAAYPPAYPPAYAPAFSPSKIRGSIFHPTFGENLNYEVKVVGDDPDGQVEGTIELMCRYALEDASSPEIQGEAQQIQAANPYQKAQVRDVWRRTQQRIQFLRDEATAIPLEFLSQTYAGAYSDQAPVVEVLVRPRDMATMRTRVGDCDDYAMYAASLLTALGIKASFVTVDGDKRAPGQFSHVYVAAYPDGQRMAVDASHGKWCGWEANWPTRRQEWPVEDPMRECGWMGMGLVGWLVVGVAGWWAWRAWA